ncbi:MAG: hypothetical protein ABF855_10205 [Liquorilactobacillus satsumensis]|uniref:hypothetical protein n=1 Tax=Liquorilactobacillus satsumensis TaxID=259059 RepID=UPI0039EBFA4A
MAEGYQRGKGNKPHPRTTYARGTVKQRPDCGRPAGNVGGRRTDLYDTLAG